MANTFNLGNGNWATKKEAVLAYNSENNNFKPLPFSFDRGSIATVVNKDGLIETVGVDEPRIDFLNNPKGHLLLEPSRRNLFTYSQDASQWGYSGIITPVSQDNSVNNPDGISGANEIIPTSASALKYFFPNNTYSHTSGDTYSFSVFAKANELKYIQITGNSNAFGSGQYANFDLENGVIGTYAGATSGTTPKIEDYGNGWYRCQFQVNASATTTQNIFLVAIVPSASASRLQALNPNGTDSLYVYGFQAELGSYATSYIPTSGSAVTRNADERTDSAIPSSIVSQTEGTIFFEINKSESTGVANQELIVLETPNRASGGLIRVLTTLSKTVMRVLFQINGGIPLDVNVSSQLTPLNTDLKFAIAFKSGDSAVYVNGVSAHTSTSTFTIPEAFNNFYLNFSNQEAKFSDIRLYNTRLSNSELQALTTI